MDSAVTRACDALLKELSLYLASVEANLAVMGHLVSPLLKGEDPALLAEEEEIGRALDEAIDQAMRAALEVQEALEHQRPLLTHAQSVSFSQANARFDQLGDYWKELMEAVTEVWRLGKRPN